VTDPVSAPAVPVRVLALVGIVLVALTLRLAVGAMSPILDRIGADVPLGDLVVALAGSAPPVMFGLAGVVTPLVVRALGLEGALVAAMLVSGLGHLARALAGESGFLLAGTALALLGAGVGNVLLPPVVKRYFPHRVGGMTSVYATVLALGATLPPALAVPAADAGGWRVSLGMWAVTGILAAAPWVWLLLTTGRHVEPVRPDGAAGGSRGMAARLLRSPIAWSTALLFGLSSIHFYAMFAWLPTLAVQVTGVDAVQAGLLLSAFALCGIPAAFVVPLIAARLTTALTVLGSGALVAGYAGFILWPAVAPLFWTILLGIGTLQFPLALTLITLRTRTQDGAVALSGFVQAIGYVLGMLGPLVAGLLVSATGSWHASLWFLLATAVLAVPGLVVLRRPGLVEDEAVGVRTR